MSQPQDVVPSSVRADGSVRKERKIRPGYVQKELVPRYQPPSLRRQQQQSDKKGKDAVDAISDSKKANVQADKSAEPTATEGPSETKMEKKRNVYVPPHLRKAKGATAERKETKDNGHNNMAKGKDKSDNDNDNNDDGLAEALEHMSLGGSAIE